MDNLNLKVRFILAGDGRPHVRRAARIKVDNGGLLLYDAHSGAVETIKLGRAEIVPPRVGGLRSCRAGDPGLCLTRRGRASLTTAEA